jgi:AbrB family looped-hinge helix DNA binding protein
MATTKMTRKGQVTIPAEIRERLDLHEGDILTVRMEGTRILFESQRRELQLAAEAVAEHARKLPPLEPHQIRELAEHYMAEDAQTSIRDESGAQAGVGR